MGIDPNQEQGMAQLKYDIHACQFDYLFYES